MTIYEVIVAIIYAASFLGFGYVMSHFVLVKETDIGKVKIIKIEDKGRMI